MLIRVDAQVIGEIGFLEFMRIAIGADHAGYPLNERVIEELRNAGHELIDFGTHDGSVPDD